MEEKLIAFESYLFEEGRRQSTISATLESLRRLLRDVETFDEEHLRAYFLSLLKRGNKATSVNGYVSAVKAYARFLETDAFDRLKFYKVTPPLKAILNENEIKAFLALPPPSLRKQDLESHYAWKMYFTILAYSGMRENEVATLRIDEVDRGRWVFELDETKTIPRVVPISKSIRAELIHYIDNLESPYLFASRHSKKQQTFSRESWKQNFDKRIARLGIQRTNLSAHSFRHSFITRMIGQGVSLKVIQKIVGHSRIETTAGYTQYVLKDAEEAMTQDPLSRENLTFTERFYQFRDIVRVALADYTLTPQEEKAMIKELSEGI